jgi:probable phosphoglycerate mutase
VTDLPLLPEGEAKVRQTARVVFGAGRLIDPAKVGRVFCSPRKRAGRTFELLMDQIPDEETKATLKSSITTTEDIAEWGYGDYEGLYTEQIRELRKQRGLDTERPWDVGTKYCSCQNITRYCGIE